MTVGQQVQAGDLLVDVQRLDRKGNPVLQGASGRVLARVEKSYSAAQPYYPTQLTLTGRSAAAESWRCMDGSFTGRRRPPTTPAPPRSTTCRCTSAASRFRALSSAQTPGKLPPRPATTASPPPKHWPCEPAGHSCTGNSRTLSSKQNAAVSTQERMPRPAL